LATKAELSPSDINFSDFPEVSNEDIYGRLKHGDDTCVVHQIKGEASTKLFIRLFKGVGSACAIYLPKSYTSKITADNSPYWPESEDEEALEPPFTHEKDKDY
jgi:hypothetical protein